MDELLGEHERQPQKYSRDSNLHLTLEKRTDVHDMERMAVILHVKVEVMSNWMTSMDVLKYALLLC